MDRFVTKIGQKITKIGRIVTKIGRYFNIFRKTQRPIFVTIAKGASFLSFYS